MRNQLRKEEILEQSTKYNMAWLSSLRSCIYASTKSRELLVNPSMLIFFSSDIEIGERAAGKKKGEGRKQRK